MASGLDVFSKRLPPVALGATHEHPGFHIALGDLATWALFVGAVFAAFIAYRAFRIQQDDSRRQTRQLERRQAENVDATWCPATSVLMLAAPIGSVSTAGRAVVVVSNNSLRPIRHVTARIEMHDGSVLKPVLVGVAVEEAEGKLEYKLFNPGARDEVGLVRRGFKYGFIFDFCPKWLGALRCGIASVASLSAPSPGKPGMVGPCALLTG
jgi:hypothetical protein